MNNFLPDTGKITVYRSGAGNGIRLDGGNAYAGAEITPYYDSLLVKAISHDRTFGRAVDKSIRVLKEIRIRGCLLYTSDAADEEDSVDLGGRRVIKKKKRR